MTDIRKFKVLALLTTVLVFLALSFNVFQEYFLSDLGGYLKRRAYFEQVISKKSLNLHKGMYWREKE